MKNIFRSLFRFVEIDYNYFCLPLPLGTKLKNVFLTNFAIVWNIIGKPKTFFSVSLGEKKIHYDSPYATKTFLVAAYDFYIETLMLSILPKNPVIVDVGANIGQFLFGVKTFFPEAKLYSFEPDPDIFKKLEQNAKQFPSTYLFNYALSNKKKKMTFYKNNMFSEWSSLIPGANQGDTQKISIQAELGDAHLSKLKHIDILKIDVEGAELEVLHGLKKSLKISDYVLLEMSVRRASGDKKASQVLPLLLDAGFEIHYVGRVFSEGPGYEQGAVDILFKNRARD